VKKIGDFWIPDVDARRGREWRKSVRLFESGRGPKIEDVEEALRYVLRWTVAIDGGANVGAYSRVMMERFDVIHAFEPAPDTYECLVRNLREWGAGARVRTYRRALSDREESVRMGTQMGRRSPSRRVVGPGDIPSVRIDDLDLPDLAFLKLDVEGYEERVLRGAAETIARYQPRVMFEDKPKKSRHFGNPRGAHEFLESLGAKALACIGPKQIDWVYGF
jgi:FkbM family methyltransferase